MSYVRMARLSMRYEDRWVLRDVSLRLAADERVGLVGKNGAGKTTVLRLILGLEQPVDGTVECNAGLRVGYFSQFSDLDGDASIHDVLLELFADVRAVEEELASVGAALETVTDPDEMEELLTRQSKLFDAMHHGDGWEYPRHIDTVLTKLGFSETRRHQPIRELSGGWRNRASLAKILLEAPDLLLLDEPTNYLDIPGVAWLEQWIRAFRGALLLISHDRQFLDAVATRIVEVENYRLINYPGNYTDYIRKKPFLDKSMRQQFEHEEELLALESEAVSDRAELGKNPSAGALRKLADIKKRRPPRPIDLIVTDIYQGLRVPDSLVRVDDLAKSYGSQRLFHDVTFEIGPEERLGIVAPNGSGKSTLIKILTGLEMPDAGRVTWEGGVGFADFNALERDLDPADTITHAVNVFGLGFGATRKQVNRFLGLLQFSEMDLGQKIGTLSGGQRARVALARCLLSGAAVLILDEPTNHVDLVSTQVMEQALIHFPGAVILVSHDRFFLDKVATRLLILDPGGPHRLYNGNWTMWQASPQQSE